MIKSKGYAASDKDSALAPYTFTRREPGDNDIQIEVLYCGVCHSDIHTVRNEWGGTIYPVVPGHEIVGRVVKTGKDVKGFKEGDLAGVGCLVDSCKECHNCKDGLEQYCENGPVFTYSSYEKNSKTVTYGGYSNNIVVSQDFVLHIPENLPIEATAPLLCAGITTYSPMRHWKMGKGHKIGVIGLGGLGHMAVKFGVSFGAEVTLLSTSPEKEQDAKKLGAHHFVLTTNKAQVQAMNNKLDFIIDTVSAPHEYPFYLNMLKTNGAMILLGVPPVPSEVHAFNLIGNRRTIAGSLIGGLPETQEMLNYCGEHNITSDVEVIRICEINEAYERMICGEVHYRFVIDMASLND